LRIEAAPPSDLPLDQSLSVKIKDLVILLVRTEAGLFALEDTCPHASQSLAQGRVESTTLACKHHGVQIDLRDGSLTRDMGFLYLEPAKVFSVSESDGMIFVDLP